MSPNLRDLLHELADHETAGAAAAAPDTRTEVRHVMTDIRSRRTRRAAASGAVAVAVLAVGVATATALGPAPRDPAVDDPTPRRTASPTPTSSPGPSPSASAVLPPVTTGEGLPPAVLLAPGVIEGSTLDWQLGLADATALGVHVLYLVEPTGKVHEVPSPVDWGEALLVDWLPGSSLAVVAASSDRGPEAPPVPSAPWQVVDLLTGMVVRDVPLDAGWEWTPPTVEFAKDGTTDLLVVTGPIQPATELRAERRGLDGTLVAITSPEMSLDLGGPELAHVSPDRRTVLLATAVPQLRRARDLEVTATLQLPRPEQPEACQLVRWLDDVEVAYYCDPSGRAYNGQNGEGELWAVPVDGGEPRLLVSGEVFPDAFTHAYSTAVTAGRRVFVQLHPADPEDATTVVRLDDDGSATEFRAGGARILMLFGSTGGRLLAGALGDTGVDLVLVDVETGVTTPVFPDAFLAPVYVEWVSTRPW